jgi:hypothetical protein
MNNIQIAHLIVKALNKRDEGLRVWRLNHKNKQQIMASYHGIQNSTMTIWNKLSPLHLTRAIQTLSPIINNPASLFTLLAKEPYDTATAATVRHILEHGV